MNVFERFAPWIQEHIYKQGWSELRPVQIAAAEALFGSSDHLLLSSGTASGKTEAAFLPALTLLGEQPASSVGILYVSPLKALINDQFVRLSRLLEEGGISVTKWHSDASPACKNRLLREPEGLLQITPESLESLLLNRKGACGKLFQDLRFVVIDEVHYFMQNERGLQLQCLLARLERLAGCNPRRIGLSATLGSPEAACDWLSFGTRRKCGHPGVQDARRRLLLSMRYFYPGEPGLDAQLYEQTLGKKTIIFTKSRLESELTIAKLKHLAAHLKSPDVYRVHHGSISAALREEAEREMKRSERPIVTGATVTLELGLDIGDLDRVVQLGAPVTASSFTQRIGRCGRQGQPAELLFLIQSMQEVTPGSPLGHIDWEFIKAIAVLQLYLEERWIEPAKPRTQPFGLLYHQAMCILAAAGELSPARLAQDVLTLPAFAHISQGDLRTLLHHLIKIDHIRKTETGGLMLGYAAEPIVTGRDFLSVFTAPEEYEVRYKNDSIGTVTQAYQPGERFVLAGRSWEVQKLDEARRVIIAARAKGEAETKWDAYVSGSLHAHLLQKMRKVLVSREDYPYLDAKSRAALQDMRAALTTPAFGHPSKEGNWAIIPGEGRCALFPWLGTSALQTLQLALREQGISSHMLPGGFTPVYLDCERCNEQKLRHALLRIRSEGIDPERLQISAKMRPPSKFDTFLPEELLRRQAIEECLDVEGAMEWLRML